MPCDFRSVSIPVLLNKLTKEEKFLLLSAPNWWNTNKIERLGIPSVRMSDGPNGVRGSSHFVSTPAQCLPASSMIRFLSPKHLVTSDIFFSVQLHWHPLSTPISSTKSVHSSQQKQRQNPPSCSSLRPAISSDRPWVDDLSNHSQKIPIFRVNTGFVLPFILLIQS